MKVLELSKEEVELLAYQLAARIDVLDEYIKEKVSLGLDFDGTYELKKKLKSIQNRLYEIL